MVTVNSPYMVIVECISSMIKIFFLQEEIDHQLIFSVFLFYKTSILKNWSDGISIC